MTYILHKKSPALHLHAGHLAKQLIEQQGLQAKHIDMLPGAAGGPKGLGLKGLDQAIFGQFLPQAKRRRALIGSSIGAWRFASILAWGVDQGTEKLADLYTHLEFYKGMKSAEISAVCDHMLKALIHGREQDIVAHPDYHLTVLAVKAQHIFSSDHALPLLASAAGIIATNTVARRYSGVFMQRVVAQPNDQMRLKLNTEKDFKTLYQNLDAENLYYWLMASGSIPGVMAGIRNIPNAPKGVYRDGGIIDYHLDLPYPSQGIVLYPHFGDKIIPSWFDKGLFWRKANPQHQARTLLISPSREYLESLPMGRLPDRKDFEILLNDPQKRIKIWKQCIAESQRLGDEFLEMVEKQDFLPRVQALK
ncbi:patatin-like phospholipase family protein [Acinetobacter qingfengensis]|uniref:Uncharacterized protein n=1 Tax=Acinetobacter qingfengensis TaxID=1262585 RepID=A0A1E7RDH8_9GAMM|nr:patatin-like phospholipase family protein [Acinetobacter qingfengensis]KAA8733725.1 patatin-like phospholipase family protein [Acinetobacter qingfengensis]OEY97459.1 hypothetical protein BJI46_09510 [Acinetobacter qingfengensis]